ncbi:MAG TPA: hypothetical protein VFD03_10985 [Clostridia bacterium]|nr:hypothetical protein [Clostridia bacterium]
MKIIKRKMIYILALAILGISFVIIGSIREFNSMFISFGIGLTVISIVKYIQYSEILKNKDKLKKYELTQSEERLVFIIDKSRNLVFVITLISEFIAMVILMIINYSLAASIVGYVICAQNLLYISIYYYYSRKY